MEHSVISILCASKYHQRRCPDQCQINEGPLHCLYYITTYNTIPQGIPGDDGTPGIPGDPGVPGSRGVPGKDVRSIQ